MAFEFKFPDVGEGIAEGEIVRWHVEEGDRIEEDQLLVEVETDKAVVEIPSPVGGTVLKRGAAVRETIRVGAVLVVIDEAGGADGEMDPGTAAAEPDPARGSGNEASVGTPAAGISATPAPSSSIAVPGGGHRVAAAPATRRLAREVGIDIRTLRGTGPAGRITADDVRLAAEGGTAPEAGTVETAASAGTRAPGTESLAGPGLAAAVESEERVPLRGLRKRISEAMVLSARTIPHVTHVDEVDVTRLIDLRARLKARWKDDWPSLSFLPFIIKAVTHGLPHHPALNASVDEEAGELVYKHHVHIGMATATPDGLIVPVIRHAGRRTILDLSREIERLAEATRTRKVPLEDLRGGTFTITNYGSLGGLFGTPIIHHPESAILGVGKFFARVVRSEEGFEERTFCYLSLSFDHRVADGAHAAEFVNRVKQYLEEPETYFLELI